MAGAAMNECDDCHESPRPGSVVRLVGKDSSGKVIVLCSWCFITRERDAALPAEPQLKVKKPKKEKRGQH